MNANELNPESVKIVAEYGQRKMSAETAAYQLWVGRLTLPGEPDPRAADVMRWAGELGYGIPSESQSEAEQSASRALDYLRSMGF